MVLACGGNARGQRPAAKAALETCWKQDGQSLFANLSHWLPRKT